MEAPPPAPVVKQVKLGSDVKGDSVHNVYRHSSVKGKPSLMAQAVKRTRRRDRRLQAKSMIDHFTSRFVDFPSDAKMAQLRATAKTLVTPGLGILAADDSIRQIDAQLEELKLPRSSNNRQRLHEVYLGGKTELEKCLTGVLMREESVFQVPSCGGKLARLISGKSLKLGVRVDKGVVPMAGTLGEYTTHGLDTVDEVCKRVKEKGVEFALWRCLYKVSDLTPSRLAILENSNTLARFAAICQNVGIVPIVSPEVLQESRHDHEQAANALKNILVGLAKALSVHHVYLEGALVRLTAAAPGICYKGAYDAETVAANTVRLLNQCLPPAIGGVLIAREHNLHRSLCVLNHMQTCPIQKPFFMTFCFSRILQHAAISVWAGNDRNLDKARAELMRRLKPCSLASYGQCSDHPPTFFISAQFSY